MPKPGTRYFGGEYTRSGVPRRGVFAAVDLKTNRLAWRQQWGEMCYAGSIVTRGGLVFIGRNDGRLTALDKANGELLWEFETDAGHPRAVTTFERNGKQYVVALSAGSFFPGTKHGDSVWLFSLDGGGAAERRERQPLGRHRARPLEVPVLRFRFAARVPRPAGAARDRNRNTGTFSVRPLLS